MIETTLLTHFSLGFTTEQVVSSTPGNNSVEPGRAGVAVPLQLLRWVLCG
jgi:hypothetical protein